MRRSLPVTPANAGEGTLKRRGMKLLYLLQLPQLVGHRSVRVRIALLVLLGMLGMAAALSGLMFGTANSLFQDRARVELTHQADSVAADINGLTARAADDLLLARQNLAFAQYFATADPAVRAASQHAIEQELIFLQQRYTIDEICVITNSGAEIARSVRGRLAPPGELSSDESANAFFAPTLALGDGGVYRSPAPYISQDTGEWV